MYIDLAIKKYLNDLAAKLPAPGGGSASALVGATGCALISMVCNFTLGKKKYAEFEEYIQNTLSSAELLRKDLLKLVDKDVEAYKKFSSSKKDEPALKDALEVPLDICRLTHSALKLCPELIEKGNKFLVSDIGCAVELLEGAFFSALFNVEINLTGIKNREYIAEINKVLDPLKNEVTNIKENVSECVLQKMRIK